MFEDEKYYRKGLHFKITFVNGKVLPFSNDTFYIQDYPNDKCLEVLHRHDDSVELFVPIKESILCIEFNLTEDDVTQ